MKTILTEQTDNLVLFPSAKNFALPENHDDPISELLNEYSHIADDDIPAYLDDRFAHEEVLGDSLSNDGAFDSLEAFMARHQTESQTPDDKLIKLINERMDAIHEAKERIKFYLNEIEMFHPKRR